VIDEFKDGVVMVNQKNHKISYQNTIMKKILGGDNMEGNIGE